MAAPNSVTDQPQRSPLIKAKWFYPTLPWFTLGIATLKHPAYWPSFEDRILHVIGCAAFSAALFAIIQPWRSDHETAVGR